MLHTELLGDALTSLVNAYGLKVILETLATVCQGKANKLESGWLDPKDEKFYVEVNSWRTAASVLGTCGSGTSV